MSLIRKILKFTLLGFLGMVALGTVISFVSEPSDTERAENRQAEVARRQQEEEASKARIKANLQAELNDNRAGVIQEINDLMGKQDYQRAYQRANRFRDFEDAELSQLAKTAKTRKEEQDAKRVAAALAKMNKSTDKVEGTDWYREKSSPVYSNQNGFFMYVGKKAASAPWLRLRIQYHADDWLFIHSFIVVADGQRFDRAGVNFERDNNSKIWEWYDETPSAADLNMIKAVIGSKEALIRFEGRQYRKDRTITPAQKAALRNVLDAYEALGGKT